MKKIYLFIPSMILSLGLLAQTPAPEVQKADTVRQEEPLDGAEVLNKAGEIGDTLEGQLVKPEAMEDLISSSNKAGVPITTIENFFSNTTWTAPAGVSLITVEAWGGGGRGGNRTMSGAAGGGGGGAFSKGTVTVTPGNTYNITVGNGANTIAPGGDSYFGDGSFVLAKGGNSVPNNDSGGAAGGNANDGKGNIVRYSGGNGGDVISGYSGGGGGGAGTGGPGGNADGRYAGAGTAEFGGNGGNGRTSNGDGNSGNNYGGGGGGERRTSSNRNPGNGAPGRIRITYTTGVLFSTPGEDTFTVPEDAKIMTVEAYGGGGGGGYSSDPYQRTGGGGGGAFNRKVFSIGADLQPLELCTIVIGAGGTGLSESIGNKNGESSLFKDGSGEILVEANGGVGVFDNSENGGSGGEADPSNLTNSFIGGRGSNSGTAWDSFLFIPYPFPYTGGGGSGAGPGGSLDAALYVGGGATNTGSGFGRGGNGRRGNYLEDWFWPNSYNGSNGGAYGGGGGGAAKGDDGEPNATGGNGGNGAVIIKTVADPTPCIITDDVLKPGLDTPGYIMSYDATNKMYYFDICEDQEISVTASANCHNCEGIIGYYWNFIDPNVIPGMTFSSSGETFTISSASSENGYQGVLVIEGKNGECYTVQEFRIRTSGGPKISEENLPDQICAGVPMDLSIGVDPLSDNITIEPYTVSGSLSYSVPINSVIWSGSTITTLPSTVTVHLDPGAIDSLILGKLTVTDAFGCSSIFDYVKDVDGIPNDVRTAMSKGDFIWSGYSNSLWTTTGSNGNWLYKTDSGFDYSSSVPGLNNNVFIAPYCRVAQMPSVSSGDDITTRDLNILSEGSLTLGSTLDIHGNYTNQGIFSAGTGSTVIFSGDLAQKVRTGGIGENHDFENVTLGKSNGNALVSLVDHNMRINGTLNLQIGIVETGDRRVEVHNSYHSAVTDGNENSYIFGNLRRYFATNTGSYAFPVGSGSYYRLAELENKSLTGINYIDARFIEGPADFSPINAHDFGTAYTSIDPAGIWELAPSQSPTGGSYDIKLWFNLGGFSLVDNQFGVIRRPSGSTSASAWIGEGLPGDGVISPENGEGRLVDHGFASRYGLTSFSEFGIGKSDDLLPIELLSFTATYRAPEVVLEWATGSEINNDFFTIERSLDVEQAEIIGYLDGAGNSSQTLWYSFVDQNPLPGISYYRLKQTDFDGKFEYFDWVAVDAGLADGDGLKVLVETHPQGHKLRIFSPGGRRLQVEVTDLLGRRVINEQLSPADQGQVEVFIPATASRQSVLIYRVTDGLEVVAGKIVR